MFAGIAEGGDHQVRRAVDDGRLLREIGCRGNEAAELDHTHHAVQIAVAGRLDLGDQVDRADLRLLVAILDGGVVAEMACRGQLAVDKGHLAGDIDHVAALDPRNIVGGRSRCVRNSDAHFIEAGFDGAGHDQSPFFVMVDVLRGTLAQPWLAFKPKSFGTGGSRKRPRTEVRGQSAGCSAGRDQLQPVVLPQVLHFRQVPLRTSVKFWHSGQDSPS